MRLKRRGLITVRFGEYKSWFMPVLLGILLTGCGGGASDEDVEGSAGGSPRPKPSCSVAQSQALEAEMDTVLAQAESEVDFSFAVERKDGRRYIFTRGNSTLQSSYESKSTSKLVSSVIILRLVEQGHLNLSDRPQDHINSWPIERNDSLYNMTLAQLLSLTSGLTNAPSCLNSGNTGFENCVSDIARANAGNGIIPGEAFFYSDTHLQVAGLMAIEARDAANWQAVFNEFRSETGLFPMSEYDFPSSSNPALAGGMHVTGEDYLDFLKALKDGLLLNEASMGLLLTDHTASVPIVYSPIFSGIGGGEALGENWHYGFGLWHECQSDTFNCTAGTRVSSPGALGSYPFWDRSKGYTGIVARAGEFGTLPSGIEIERTVRSSVEKWAAC